MDMTRSRRERGSIVTVVLVAAVLAALGAVAVLMSTSFGRTEHHEKLVYDARQLARTAVEEASLLINNGKRNVEIDQALGTSKPVRVQIASAGDRSPLSGLPEERRPKVYVKASLVNNTTGLYRQSARGQMDSIQKFLLPAADQKARDFWNRVDREGLRDEKTGADTAGDSPNSFVGGWVQKVGLSKWKPEFRQYKDKTRPSATVPGKNEILWKMKPRMKELAEVWALFRTANSAGAALDSGQDYWVLEGQDPNSSITITDRSKPDLGEFTRLWTSAVTAVAKDAAKKVEACGANPSLAMAHLVGDLKLGEEIASGAEVQCTADFMRDPVIGTNKTYLLEISTSMGYSGHRDRMKGQTAFRSYRLFQKAEWEMAMKMMARSLASDLQNVGAASLTTADIARCFPAKVGVKGRAEPVPDASGKDSSDSHDPKAMFDDIVYAQMPSTVGARLYPYGVASVSWNPDKLTAADKDDAP
jgi:hypothetical protein